jgi:hypothetical protein
MNVLSHPGLFSRVLGLHTSVGVDLDAGYGVHADEGAAVLGRPVVGALQQHRVTEPVAQPQIDADGRVDVGEHPVDTGIQNDLLHSLFYALD